MGVFLALPSLDGRLDFSPELVEVLRERMVGDGGPVAGKLSAEFREPQIVRRAWGRHVVDIAVYILQQALEVEILTHVGAPHRRSDRA
jgi:hypothetical protein